MRFYFTKENLPEAICNAFDNLHERNLHSEKVIMQLSVLQ